MNKQRHRAVGQTQQREDKTVRISNLNLAQSIAISWAVADECKAWGSVMSEIDGIQSLLTRLGAPQENIDDAHFLWQIANIRKGLCR